MYDYKKISVGTYRLDGRLITIRVVRDSKLCRLFTDSPSLVIGNTIYVRTKGLTPKILRAGMETIEAYPRWLHGLWKLIGK